VAAAAPGGGELAGVQSQIDSGDVDGALQRISQSTAAGSPEGLYLQGQVWAKKAETAPLPTPEALPPGSPRGAVPITPEFKAEELKAIDLYERAIAAAPEDARAQLGLARMLAPHAQRRHDAQVAAAAAAAKKPVRAVRGKRTPEPVTPPPPPPGPDANPARVARAYRAAVQALPKDSAALEAYYTFAVHTELLDDADWALKQAIARDKESPEPLVRYGDFLLNVRKRPDEAIAQYRAALLWKDDKAIKEKIGEIHLSAGMAHLQQTEWSLADASYREAQKWAAPGSDLAKRIDAEIEHLRRASQ
jgi:tetratricopeptide (TPR) repeat protein